MSKDLNELQQILKRIQFITNDTVEKIAKDVKYDRSYLTNEVNKGDNQRVKKRLLAYEKKIQQNVSIPEEANMLNEPSVPYGTMSGALMKLIDSNAVLAKSHADLSASHVILVETNKRLADRVLDTPATVAHSPAKILEDVDARLSNLLELISPVAAGKKYKSSEEFSAAVNKFWLDKHPNVKQAKGTRNGSDIVGK